MIEPAVLRALQAAGATTDMILAAIEADAQIERDRIIRRRGKDAERQRKSRASRSVTVTPRDGSDMVPNDIYSNPPNSPSEITSPTVKRGKPHPFPCPDLVEPDYWRDFMANRKRKRLPSTQAAYDGIIADIGREATDEWPPGRLVQHAAAKGWGSIHNPANGFNGNGIANGKPFNLRGSRPDPALDMWRQAHAELAAEDPGKDPGIGFTAWPALPPHGSG